MGGVVMATQRTGRRFFDVPELSKAVGQAVIAECDSDGWSATISRLRRLPCDGDAVFDVAAIAREFEL
jgi:hypothetical protein